MSGSSPGQGQLEGVRGCEVRFFEARRWTIGRLNVRVFLPDTDRVLNVELPANTSGVRILIMRTQSLFKSIGCPVSLLNRRSLFSVIFPVYSARMRSNLSFETHSARRLGLSPRLSLNSSRPCSSTALMSSSVSHPEYRLPPNVKPTHYDLTIRTNLENQLFDGFVDVQCVTDQILSTPKSRLRLPKPRCPPGHLRTHL